MGKNYNHMSCEERTIQLSLEQRAARAELD